MSVLSGTTGDLGPAEPSPMTVTICRVCEQPWLEHERLATTREVDEDTWDVVTVVRPPRLTDCIELLKVANRGPQGLVGPQGPVGAMGATGERGPAGPPGRNAGEGTP